MGCVYHKGCTFSLYAKSHKVTYHSIKSIRVFTEGTICSGSSRLRLDSLSKTLCGERRAGLLLICNQLNEYNTFSEKPSCNASNMVALYGAHSWKGQYNSEQSCFPTAFWIIQSNVDNIFQLQNSLNLLIWLLKQCHSIFNSFIYHFPCKRVVVWIVFLLWPNRSHSSHSERVLRFPG